MNFHKQSKWNSNSKSENLTKIKVRTGSLTSHTGNKGALVHMYFRNAVGCAYWSGALIKANTVVVLQ